MVSFASASEHSTNAGVGLLSAGSVLSVLSLPTSIPSKVFSSPTVTRGDLPSLRACPSADVLLKTLNTYSRNYGKNFIAEEDLVPTPDGFINWLTRLVSSDLDWINDEDIREEIWSSASKRIAERCGRTATPNMIREFEVKGISNSVLLQEPSLTADSLGLKTWGSSLLLSQRLCKYHNEILPSHSRRVLELGSGTGLVGIVLGALGYPTTMTDLPDIVENLEHNLRINRDRFGPEGMLWDVKIEELNWMNLEASKSYKRGDKYETIILSDPVYSLSHPPMIANVLKELLEFSNSQSRVIVQVPIRENFADVRKLFWDKLYEIGLSVTVCDHETGRDDFGEGLFFWSVWRPKLYIDSIEIDMNTLP